MVTQDVLAGIARMVDSGISKRRVVWAGQPTFVVRELHHSWYYRPTPQHERPVHGGEASAQDAPPGECAGSGEPLAPTGTFDSGVPLWYNCY